MAEVYNGTVIFPLNKYSREIAVDLHSYPAPLPSIFSQEGKQGKTVQKQHIWLKVHGTHARAIFYVVPVSPKDFFSTSDQ